jgi:hypothetical protein
MRKHFKTIVILSLFFFLISSFGSNASIKKPDKPEPSPSYKFGLEIIGWPGQPPSYFYSMWSFIRQCEKKNYTTQITYRTHEDWDPPQVVELDLSFLKTEWCDENGENCDGEACFPLGTYTGTLAIAKDSSYGLAVVFLFSALDKKGNETGYRLFLFNGTIVGGDCYSPACNCPDCGEPLNCDPGYVPWPPQDPDEYTSSLDFSTTIIEFDEWETFVLGNKRNKCVGSGFFTAPVSFIVTNHGEV